MRKPTWTEITESATESGNGWSNANIAKFHYFNPSGMLSKKRETDKQISEMASQGKCANGAILAYGTFNDYNANNLRRLATERKSVSSAEISVALKMLGDDVRKAKSFIAERG